MVCLFRFVFFGIMCHALFFFFYHNRSWQMDGQAKKTYVTLFKDYYKKHNHYRRIFGKAMENGEENQ